MTLNKLAEQESAQDPAPSTPTTTGNVQPHHKSTVMQKRVLAGGSVGQFIEFYDFTLYGLTAWCSLNSSSRAATR